MSDGACALYVYKHSREEAENLRSTFFLKNLSSHSPLDVSITRQVITTDRITHNKERTRDMTFLF